jgi:hypothetical protein
MKNIIVNTAVAYGRSVVERVLKSDAQNPNKGAG